MPQAHTMHHVSPLMLRSQAKHSEYFAFEHFNSTESVVTWLVATGLQTGRDVCILGNIQAVHTTVVACRLAFGLYGAALAAIAIHATVAVLVLGYVISW